ncbi:putative 4-hydroxy-4-methyl-2-oxoglutarate aldolase 3 [Lotus japonicus]|uniref:putative 4-hydroxy-4-methyl-2-oxoglutarate aldolase 3 n=1 Tax=Lotus japonicus TaxID=34305 RepID=UPI0025838700|nr:putative 4-hydroxy-4-methyl-2-oxoglutarate aldolase 3 [Lotus japonicus]
MGGLAIADICDVNTEKIASGEVRILDPVFQSYGQARTFSGPIVTVKVFEDNVLIKEVLQTKGEGKILVIDGGGSMRRALIGGHLVELAHSNGWAGIVVNGCVRDVDDIYECGNIGVMALGSYPLRPGKKGTGKKHVPVHVAGATIHEGEWLYADNDGVLVSKFQILHN